MSEVSPVVKLIQDASEPDYRNIFKLLAIAVNTIAQATHLQVVEILAQLFGTGSFTMDITFKRWNRTNLTYENITIDAATGLSRDPTKPFLPVSLIGAIPITPAQIAQGRTQRTLALIQSAEILLELGHRTGLDIPTILNNTVLRKSPVKITVPFQNKYLKKYFL